MINQMDSSCPRYLVQTVNWAHASVCLLIKSSKEEAGCKISSQGIPTVDTQVYVFI